MGQGLAVLAILAGATVLSAGGVMGYLLSLRTASWDARSKAVEQQIRQGRQDIQRLRMEIMFRSRFPELSRWSGPLGLGPAQGRQYAAGIRDIHSAAAERKTALEKTGCGVAPPLVSACPDHRPVGGSKGYARDTRKRMDDLIGAVAP